MDTKEYTAKHRYADVTARKIRPFADLIRGRHVDEAIELLKYEPNRGAMLVRKVLLSAIGNAKDKGIDDTDDLVVTTACIDDGPMFKRMRPKSRGSANMILRRMAHIRIGVALPAEEDAGVEQAKVVVSTPAKPVAGPAQLPVSQEVTNEQAKDA